MDEDLENYVRELERIDRADNPVLNKSMQMQVGANNFFNVARQIFSR